MRKLTRADLWSLEDYAVRRTAFRAEIMAHKDLRRVALGPHATLLFEDRLTMKYQVQEMLRAERIFEADAIEDELATYNALIPDGGNWKATFLIEYEDVAERAAALARMPGVEYRVWLRVGETPRTFAFANDDMERTDRDRTAAVHFLRFELDDGQTAALSAGARVAIGIDHDELRCDATLEEPTVASLWRDLGLADSTPRASTVDADLRQRIATDIQAWDGIDDHRTGTVGDRITSEWLAGLVQEAGQSPLISEFDLRRWVLRSCQVQVGTRVVEGVPLFDGGITGPNGATAKLTALPRPAAADGIGVTAIGGDAGEGNRTLAEARRANAHPALLAVTKMDARVPGLALQNAEHFTAPFGPPVLQVSGECEAWLRDAVRAGEAGRVTVDVAFEDARGTNVGTRIVGRDATLPPLVVMTPKSSWWHSTAERGGGIAVWLALLRHFAARQPDRDVVLVATSGHELGHLGLAHYLAVHAKLAHGSHAWIHLGANFAAVDSRTRLQASDAPLCALARQEMAAAGAPPADLTPVGTRPGGEARNIHDLDGRYISYLGTNPWFHHVDDRWPTTVDVAKAERLTRAMLAIASRLAIG